MHLYLFAIFSLFVSLGQCNYYIATGRGILHYTQSNSGTYLVVKETILSMDGQDGTSRWQFETNPSYPNGQFVYTDMNNYRVWDVSGYTARSGAEIMMNGKKSGDGNSKNQRFKYNSNKQFEVVLDGYYALTVSSNNKQVYLSPKSATNVYQKFTLVNEYDLGHVNVYNYMDQCVRITATAITGNIDYTQCAWEITHTYHLPQGSNLNIFDAFGNTLLANLNVSGSYQQIELPIIPTATLSIPNGASNWAGDTIMGEPWPCALTISFNFLAGEVTGTGSDCEGNFELWGTYDSTTLTFWKSYPDKGYNCYLRSFSPSNPTILDGTCEGIRSETYQYHLEKI